MSHEDRRGRGSFVLGMLVLVLVLAVGCSDDAAADRLDCTELAFAPSAWFLDRMRVVGVADPMWGVDLDGTDAEVCGHADRSGVAPGDLTGVDASLGGAGLLTQQIDREFDLAIAEGRLAMVARVDAPPADGACPGVTLASTRLAPSGGRPSRTEGRVDPGQRFVPIADAGFSTVHADPEVESVSAGALEAKLGLVTLPVRLRGQVVRFVLRDTRLRLGDRLGEGPVLLAAYTRLQDVLTELLAIPADRRPFSVEEARAFLDPVLDFEPGTDGVCGAYSLAIAADLVPAELEP